MGHCFGAPVIFSYPYANVIFDGATTVTHGARIPTSPGFIGPLTISTATHLGADNPKSVLFANDNGNPLSPGGRFTLGGWLDNDQTFGIEARYLLLNSYAGYRANPGDNVLAIPYQNALTGAQASYFVNLPGTYTSFTSTYINTTPGVFVHLSDSIDYDLARGSLDIRSTSFLQGGEANAVLNLGRAANWRLEGIAGLRFIELDETLFIGSSVSENYLHATAFEPALGLPTGATQVVDQFVGVVNRMDNFETRNTFYGGQLGLRGDYGWGRFSISAGGQVGLGLMHEEVSISGSTETIGTTTMTPTQRIFLAGIPLIVATGAPNQVTTGINSSRGGLFAQPTNSGIYNRDRFAVVPEGILKLNYRFTDRITGSIGYTFRYMSSVARPGDQINTTVNPALLTTTPSAATPSQPSFQFHSGDYWAQGINFGVELRY